MKTKDQSRIDQILADADDWGPNSELGNSEEHVEAASEIARAEVDAALGMRMISIRLGRILLRDLKAIAEFHGIGYQPMIRDLLGRFVRSEIHGILRQKLAEVEAAAKVASASTPPVEEFMRKRA